MSRQRLRRSVRARWLTLRGRREDAVVALARGVPGLLHRDEMALLYRTARDLALPGDIAEVGSWKGRSAVTMGLALQDAGRSDRTIFCIDPHQGSEEHAEIIAREGSTLPAFRENVRAAGVADLVAVLPMTSSEGACVLAERGVKLAMAFIDGAHDEQSVREDICAFLPLVISGGIIALDDCVPDGQFPGVWKAYQSELAPRVTEIGRASTLLVTQLRV